MITAFFDKGCFLKPSTAALGWTEAWNGGQEIADN